MQLTATSSSTLIQAKQKMMVDEDDEWQASNTPFTRINRQSTPEKRPQTPCSPQSAQVLTQNSLSYRPPSANAKLLDKACFFKLGKRNTEQSSNDLRDFKPDQQTEAAPKPEPAPRFFIPKKSSVQMSKTLNKTCLSGLLGISSGKGREINTSIGCRKPIKMNLGSGMVKGDRSVQLEKTLSIKGGIAGGGGEGVGERRFSRIITLGNRQRGLSAERKMENGRSAFKVDWFRSRYPPTGLVFEENSLLGEGSFGKVHLALDTQTSKQVACKCYPRPTLPTHTTPDRKSIQTEISALQMLSHPSIVSLYRIAHTSAHIYIIMEYIGDITLGEYIKNRYTDRHYCNDAIGRDDVYSIIVQILNGVEYMHSRGVYHRDIKPDNIVLGEGKRAVIIDFGLCLITDRPNEWQSAYCGTLVTSSPEMVGREGYLPGPNDIWAVGVVLYLMLTGKYPFGEGEGTKDRILAVQYSKQGLSLDEQDLFNRIFTSDPEGRIDAGGFRTEIERLAVERKMKNKG